MFAELLKETINKKVMNKKINAYKDLPWVEYDPTIQDQFEFK